MTSIETFPPRNQSNYLYLHELNPSDREIVDKHLRFSGKLRMFDNIRQNLIDQIHQKKAVKNHPQGLTKDYYTKYLFEGHRSIINGGPILSALKSHLETTLVYELSTRNFDCMFIYYHLSEKPGELLYDSYNPDAWMLDPGLEMTCNDIHIMERYKTMYLDFLHEAVDALRSGPEKTRIQKLVMKLEATMTF
jgi:hypothetical protein